VLDKLNKENIELKQNKIYVICGNKNIDFVFQPCGHLACDLCSELGICTCKIPFERNSCVTCKIIKQDVLYCRNYTSRPSLTEGNTINTYREWPKCWHWIYILYNNRQCNWIFYSRFQYMYNRNNISASTGGHELLVVRSPQEQHDHNEHGSTIILCHIFSPNLKIHWIKLIMSQVCMFFLYTSKY
jgi:hypothetical protein